MGYSWNIRKVEGGFVVETYVETAAPPGQENIVGVGLKRTERVFTDSAALLNFLHNELVGSN